jgi:cardiolipin synthase
MFSDFSFNIPNLLTFLRILLVPVFVGLVMDGSFTAATVVFIVAGLTDGLDGFIAKKYKMVTEFGVWLDPFADKFLLVSAFVVLALKGWIPLYLLALVILRDVVIVGGIVWLRRSGKDVEIDPAVAGKATTFAQIMTVVWALFTVGEAGAALTVLVLVTAALTVYSGFVYVLREIRIQSSRSENKGPGRDNFSEDNT